MACCCELQNTLDVEVTQDTLDVEIGGSAGVLLQAKSVEVTANGTSVVAPDDGFDGLKSVEINTNVPKRIECGAAYFKHPESDNTSLRLIGLLQKINVSCWDTSKVTDMQHMFNSCSSLQQLDVSGWDTSKVTNIGDMFYSCRSLRTIIGEHTIQDVESGLKTMIGLKISIKIQQSPLRFSSILALANGLADLTGATAQTLTISAQSYTNMYNDDDTTPTADLIAERQARIAAICASKNWNFAH